MLGTNIVALQHVIDIQGPRRDVFTRVGGHPSGKEFDEGESKVARTVIPRLCVDMFP